MIGTLITIGVDGSEKRQPLNNPKCYAALKEAVGGGFDLVPRMTSFEGKRCDAYVHDEGIFTLPVNPTATQMWGQVCEIGDYKLHGPLVIMTGDDEFMDAQL